MRNDIQTCRALKSRSRRSSTAVTVLVVAGAVRKAVAVVVVAVAVAVAVAVGVVVVVVVVAGVEEVVVVAVVYSLWSSLDGKSCERLNCCARSPPRRSVWMWLLRLSGSLATFQRVS